MKGVILGYFEDKKNGYISGDDNNRYEFSMEDWKEKERNPEKGIRIVFVTDGKKANDIYELKFELNLDKDKNKQKFNFSLPDFLNQNNKLIKKVLLFGGISITSIGLISLTLFFLKSKQLEKIEASQVIVESINTDYLSNNIEEIKEIKSKLEKELNEIKSLPNYPTSAYDQGQELISIINEKVNQATKKENELIELEKQAKDNFSLSLKSATKATEIAKNPPHSAEVWQEAKTEWESAINYLKSAPENASLQKDIAEKVDTYTNSLEEVNQRLKEQIKAEDNFKSAIETVNSAIYITKSYPSEPSKLEESVKKWEDAIKLLKDIPAGTILYKQAQDKIPEYQKNMSALKQKFNKLNDEKKADTFIDNYMNFVGSNYGYSRGVDDVKFWCSFALDKQVYFEHPVQNYAILWKKFQGDNAIYRTRIETNYIINDYTINLTKKSSAWCLSQLN
jgi:hypothetical protein